jgi:hypothetical protein
MRRGSFWLLMLCFFLFCCAKQEPMQQIPEGLAVSEEQLSYLGALRAAHRRADLFEEQKHTTEIVRVLQEVLSLPRPAGSAVEDAYLDLAGRLATVLRKEQKISEALSLVQKTKAEISRDSFYLGALLLVEGEIYEARAEQKRAMGDASAADDDRTALAAYEASQQVNQRVLQSLQENK